MEFMYLVGAFLALLASFVWGINGLIMKQGADGEEPGRALMWRGLSASPLLFVATYVVYGPLAIERLFRVDVVYLIVLSAFTVSIGDYLMISALKKAPVSVVVPVSASYPLFGAFFILIARIEAFNPMVILATIIVVLGIVLIAQQTSKNNENTQQENEEKQKQTSTPENKNAESIVFGIILAVIAASAWGISIMLLKIILVKPGISGLSLTAIRTGVIAIIGGLFFMTRVKLGYWDYSIDKEGQHRVRNYFLLSGLLGWVIGATAFMYSIQLVGALVATPLSATNPLFASIFGVVFLHERVSFIQAVGIILVIIGSIIIVI